MRVAVLALLVATLGVVPGCALTSKGTPLDIRYFSPDALVAPTLTSAAALRHEAQKAVPLCLGRVSSSGFLRNEIVYRVSAYEVGTYEDRRWTEYPEVYLRRALRSALYDSGRFAEASGACPTLDVDLLGFEEVRQGAARSGRVRIAFRVQAGPTLMMSDVITSERTTAASEGMDGVVAAIGAALGEATAQLAGALAARLGAPGPAPVSMP